MKAILSMALVLGLCGFARAADKVDPVGTWNCEYEIGGQQRTSTLEIKKDGDKLSGTMSWANQKDEKLKDLKFKEGKLTFSAVRKIMDNEIPIDYTLTIDGDKWMVQYGDGQPGKAKHVRDYSMKPGDAYLYDVGVLHSPRRENSTRLLRIEGINMDKVKRFPYEAVDTVNAAAE